MPLMKLNISVPYFEVHKMLLLCCLKLFNNFLHFNSSVYDGSDYLDLQINWIYC